MVILDPYNLTLVCNFIVVSAAKRVHAEFQVCFSFLSFFLFFSLFIFNFFLSLRNVRSPPAATLGLFLSPH